MGVNARQRWRPSLPRARRHPPRSLARRVAPDCGPWPCRVTRQCGDQGCAFIARHNSRVRPAAPAVSRQRPVPVPGDRGLGFLHAARERRPLDELAGVPITALRCAALRSLHADQIATPVTRHARCRAAECIGSLAAARPPRQSSHRAPAIKPASTAEGDLWCEDRCAWPGIWLTALAGENPCDRCCAASSHARLFFRHGGASVHRWAGSAAKGVRNIAPTATQ